MFHGALGASVANLARLLFRGGDPRRYALQDTFILLSYNFGYSVIPYMLKDQISKGPQENPLGQALSNRNVMRLTVEASGVAGVLYGLFLIRVAKLGLRMFDKRPLHWKVFSLATPVLLPILISELLIEKAGRRTYNEPSLFQTTEAGAVRHSYRPFDPIESYTKHFFC